MRNIRIALLAVLLLTAALSVAHSAMTVRTPELFGDGRAYILKADRFVFGYISAWGGWIVYGSTAECRIVQIAGERIDGAENPVPCFMDFSKARKFRGWIDFRGHARPFCGAENLAEMPKRCFPENLP